MLLREINFLVRSFSAESTFTDLGQLFALIFFFFVGFTLVTDTKVSCFHFVVGNWIKVFFVSYNEFVGIKRSLCRKKYLELLGMYETNL